MLITSVSLFSVLSAQGSKSHDEDYENKTVKITVNFSPLYNGGNLEIYNDTYQRLSSSLMQKLTTARRIPIVSLYKEALSEGKYTVDVYENSLIVQSYIVLNSGDVYDKTHDYYLRCDALADIYRIFVHFLLRERIDTKLQ
jgi:hypothetical protein